MITLLLSLQALLLFVLVVNCSPVDAFHLVPVSSPFLSSTTRSLPLSVIQMAILSDHQKDFHNDKDDHDHDDDDDDDFSISPIMSQRRYLLHKALWTATTAVSAVVAIQQSPSQSSSTLQQLLLPQAAWASGGATAGRYTTIPIAKRRYYGRVQQAVHEFVGMGKDMVSQDMNAASIQAFFDPQGTVIVPSKRTSSDINGQCTKKDGDCRGKEIRDSRWNDMKASMYLLGNAFRTDQQKPPDRLPTVKAARAFFAKVDAMEKSVRVKTPKTKDTATVQLYADALDILDAYLDLVELPPIDSGHYEQEFNTLVGETARIT